MKVLRAIGGFFAKIGRWIANTAWIQPLLIVGGIFGIIFSIPYIKQAIDNSKIDTTDYDYEYYKDYKLGLEEDGRADKLLSYIANEDLESIDSEFGEKFFLSFIRKECSGCTECIDGFQNFNSHAKDGEKLKLYTIVVDELDSDDEYPAMRLFKDNADFFGKLSTIFGEEEYGEYILHTNASTQFNTIKTNLDTVARLDYATADASGFLTPLTVMYDSAKYRSTSKAMYSTGVTAVFFNYTELISGGNPVNKASKAQILLNCGNYENVFSPNYNKDID